MVCGFSKEVFAMKKRLLAALLSAVLLLTLVPTAFAASDLDGHWAKKYIDYLADEDVTAKPAGLAEMLFHGRGRNGKIALSDCKCCFPLRPRL